ncbi:hypothetical protein B0I31_101256 [Saccharothrix carnea]|uniref:Uncharacterized protein n=1 Tax=Saccharothrix carnea TaxID=1280637 RepID=A0A2P8IHV3_SACCR|nr:hypothetical protein B0I31_101256 [Saccharothrix carnea]
MQVARWSTVKARESSIVHSSARVITGPRLPNCGLDRPPTPASLSLHPTFGLTQLLSVTGRMNAAQGHPRPRSQPTRGRLCLYPLPPDLPGGRVRDHEANHPLAPHSASPKDRSAYPAGICQRLRLLPPLSARRSQALIARVRWRERIVARPGSGLVVGGSISRFGWCTDSGRADSGGMVPRSGSGAAGASAGWGGPRQGRAGRPSQGRAGRVVRAGRCPGWAVPRWGGVRAGRFGWWAEAVECGRAPFLPHEDGGPAEAGLRGCGWVGRPGRSVGRSAEGCG